MKQLTLTQIRITVRGKALSAGNANAVVTSISNNTRDLQPGALYVAIRGERLDGHAFLPDAAARGAIAAIVEHPPVTPQPNLHLIQVPDARIAFGQLATYVRSQMRSKVIGVAGSNGKTSTKKLIDAALRGKLRGSISPKSFNNDIGVPITIFAANPNDDYLVLEMGTNHHGEIARLTNMAQPDIAVITNAGAEHLEHLGDLAGVRRENATVIAGLNPGGALIVNGDDADLLTAVGGYRGKRITFGFSPSNDLFATDIDCTARGTRFKLNGRREVFVPLLGRHTASNALAAIAVGRRMGVSEDAILASLADATGADMRLELAEFGGVTLLNDAYNANPSSMRAGLQTLVDLPAKGRRVAILGDMLELGRSSDQYHKEIGQVVAGAKVDLLICVGKSAALAASAAMRAGMPKAHIHRYTTAVNAAKTVPKLLARGDLILLKASRSMRLEDVAKSIETARTKPIKRKAAG
jgi:UDP-N-acetylmuramoyl-tripeptide--D-alanyl-D-alanine ligase